MLDCTVCGRRRTRWTSLVPSTWPSSRWELCQVRSGHWWHPTWSSIALSNLITHKSIKWHLFRASIPQSEFVKHYLVRTAPVVPEAKRIPREWQQKWEHSFFKWVSYGLSFFPEVTTSLLSPIHCPSRSSQGTLVGKCFHPQASGPTESQAGTCVGLSRRPAGGDLACDIPPWRLLPRAARCGRPASSPKRFPRQGLLGSEAGIHDSKRDRSRCSFSGLRSLFLEGTA